MSTTEEMLKEYILEKYKSIREFVQVADLKYSTVDSILKRGIDNSSISNVMKICKVLKISVDELAEGRITPIKRDLSRNFETVENEDISYILEDTKKRLETCNNLMLDGKKVDQKTVSTIIQAIDIGEEMAKKS